MSSTVALVSRSVARHYRNEPSRVAGASVYTAPDGARYLAHETKAGVFVAKPAAEKGPLVFRELPVHPRLRPDLARDLTAGSAGFYVALVDRFTLASSMLVGGLKLSADTDLESAEIEQGSHRTRKAILSIASRLCRSINPEDVIIGNLIIDFSRDPELRHHYQQHKSPFAIAAPLDVHSEPGDTFEVLKSKIEDGDTPPFYVKKAIDDLATLGDSRGFNLLVELISNDTGHRHSAAKALGVMYRRFS
jgi:hypothetical protein